MTLDDIENAIFQGQKGFDQALDLIERYKTNKKHFLNDGRLIAINQRINGVKQKLNTIPTQFLNKISVTLRYKNYIRSVTPVGKIESVSAAATKVLEIVTEDSNKRILSAKEPATKRNRQYEKTEVIKFFHQNYNSIVALFELYNLLHDIKDVINN
jgi:hypothetical protein